MVYPSPRLLLYGFPRTEIKVHRAHLGVAYLEAERGRDDPGALPSEIAKSIGVYHLTDFETSIIVSSMWHDKVVRSCSVALYGVISVSVVLKKKRS